MYENSVNVTGNVGNDPEMKGDILTFSIANNPVYKDPETGERTTKTIWHNIVVWEKSKEWLYKNLKKGDKVYIRGTLNQRSYTDLEGNEKVATEIKSNSVQIIMSKADKEILRREKGEPNYNREEFNI